MGSLQDEIKQKRPFTSLEEEAFLTLQLTADRLATRGAEMLKSHGLSAAQYNTLRILRGAAPHGLACREIAERMINRDPDVTRMLDRLQARGLVKRQREQQDRRVITARITPEGLKLLRTLDEPVRQFQKELLGSIGGSRLKSLIRLLDAVREHAR